MSAAVHRSNASLRTKTGCLTCRSRRKKCDEQRPVCVSCIKSQRICEWPASSDLIDRRNRPHPQHRRLSTASQSNAIVAQRGLTAEAAVSNAVVGSCLEIVVGRHFIDSYYSTLINPDSHHDFYDDWITDIQNFMEDSTGLRYSVLANAASNLYLSGEPGQMQELALSYYSQSLRGVTWAVVDASDKQEDRRNAVLMSVMLLYLHGCMGHGTYDDIPLHVDAAVRMITWRFLEGDPPPRLTRPFDRLAVESVIYQVYLCKMGLWSEREGQGLQFTFDPHFWLKCEALLARSIVFPELSNTLNSPVLGLPFAIFKIMLMIRTLWEEDRTTRSFRHSVRRLKDELQPWETWLQEGDPHIDAQMQLHTTLDVVAQSMTKDAATLMVSSASLLLSQLEQWNSSVVPSPPATSSWQRILMVAVLQRRRNDQQWSICCLANYPVYVSGHFMGTTAEIELVRNEMRQRASKMAWSQVHRFWDDLEGLWSSRDQGAILVTGDAV